MYTYTAPWQGVRNNFPSLETLVGLSISPNSVDTEDQSYMGGGSKTPPPSPSLGHVDTHKPGIHSCRKRTWDNKFSCGLNEVTTDIVCVNGH